MRNRRVGALALGCALIASVCVACSSSSGKTGSPPTTREKADVAKAAAASFAAHGSVGQVYLVSAPKQANLELLDANDGIVARATTDKYGSLIFRDVPVGTGYRVATADNAQVTNRVDVTAWDKPPPPQFYMNAKVNTGYGYLTMRDDVQLSATIKLPGPIDKGPYPTVIEYSGYSPADPKSPQPSTLITQNMGYATVGVNMRGTGCSGGAFSFFEPLQSTDGYDVIEEIAQQPWVAHHKVGMVGISYPGISQLFVAQLRPPHLAAIAPLSVIDDTYKGTLYPGGILNNGFAVGWGKDRQHDAEPAPGGGQGWATDRINEGDKQCLANQALHSQAPDILKLINDNKYWTDAEGVPLSPDHFVNKINVPVYLAGQWQDEQTGGYFANLFDKFTGTKDAWFTAQNGSHVDSLDPTVFARCVEFLSIFVKQEVPKQDALEGIIASVIQSSSTGTHAPLPTPDPFANVKTLAAARHMFEQFPRIRILFENGAGGPAGEPTPRFEADYPSWPIPATTATRWWFGSNGTLAANQPSAESTDSYTYDPSRSQDTTITGGDSEVWGQLPKWNWPAPKPGTALAYTTAPLTQDTAVIGNASVDLWLKSTAQDTDVQVTITEVRPDGTEMFVQNGWLRASMRKLAPDATELRPTHTFTEADAAPLPAGQWSSVRVEVFPFAHVFRKGSRIRVIIDAPGASRPRWKFQALPAQVGEKNMVSVGGVQNSSSIVLPVVAGVKVVGGIPPCPSLRGQPCRPTANIP
jgi:predicted acyl esterase